MVAGLYSSRSAVHIVQISYKDSESWI
uniref:Uncharacterized protein n=1 Tax=Arundo donax TaxID=35708 RepID=A0A0A9EZK3_ARUDO